MGSNATLFHLKDHPEYGIVRIANENLADSGRAYLGRFGPVASDEWWHHYDAGHISRTHKVGQVVHMGPVEEPWGETSDIIRIATDRRDIEYDREGHWLDSRLTVGTWVHIESAKVVTENSSGVTTTEIDVHIWIEVTT